MTESPFNGLSARYESALRSHINDPSQANLHLAAQLGTQAVALGMVTLDLARVHDHALTALIDSDSSPTELDDLAVRAGVFFTEALFPVEPSHGAAQAALAEIIRLNATFENDAAGLAETKRVEKAGIISRGQADAVLKNRMQLSADLLRDSRALEAKLLNLTQQDTTATEEQREHTDPQLNEEIGRALLGIHVRLIALKKEVAAHGADFTDEIATTQRLVEDSANAIHRLTRNASMDAPQSSSAASQPPP